MTEQRSMLVAILPPQKTGHRTFVTCTKNLRTKDVGSSCGVPRTSPYAPSSFVVIMLHLGSRGTRGAHSGASA